MGMGMDVEGDTCLRSAEKASFCHHRPPCEARVSFDTACRDSCVEDEQQTYEMLSGVSPPTPTSPSLKDMTRRPERCCEG